MEEGFLWKGVFTKEMAVVEGNRRGFLLKWEREDFVWILNI